MELFLLRRNILAQWWFWPVVIAALAFLILSARCASACEGSAPSIFMSACKRTVEDIAPTHRKRHHHRAHKTRAKTIEARKGWGEQALDLAHENFFLALRINNNKALIRRAKEWFQVFAEYRPLCGPTPDWQSFPIPTGAFRVVPRACQDSVPRFQGARADQAFGYATVHPR